MSQPVRFYRSYEVQAAAWDEEFTRVSARFGERMQCRKGCSMCCSQMFSISLLEGAVIARAMRQLPDDRRARLRDAAIRYLDRARESGFTAPDGADTLLPRPGVRLPCPALQDDACSIYDARPLICRKWGIPVFDASKPDRLHACELNFRAGEDLDARGLVEPQRVLLEQWAAVKDDLRDALQAPLSRTTIAEAMATGLDQWLEAAMASA